MAPQGAPEVLKWSPRMSKMDAPSSLNGVPRSQKGPAAEGVALKIKKKPADKHEHTQLFWSKVRKKLSKWGL